MPDCLLGRMESIVGSGYAVTLFPMKLSPFLDFDDFCNLTQENGLIGAHSSERVELKME